MSKILVFKNKHIRYGLLFLIPIIALLAVYKINWHGLFLPLESFVIEQQVSFDGWLKNNQGNYPLTLPILAFFGGLLASISPCKLALLTVNLSYIGTTEINSRWDALKKAIAFVFGVIFVLSLLGLVSSLASAILFQFRGYINLFVSLIMLGMGLSLLEIIHIPFSQFNSYIYRVKSNFPRWIKQNFPQDNHISQTSSSQTSLSQATFSKSPSKYMAILQPFGVGVSFALVGSPCSSPVLVSVLSAAAATGNPFYSVLIMIFYAIGDTIVIFLASLFTGLATQTRQFIKLSTILIRIGGILLMIAGCYYLFTGLRWIFG